MIGKNTANCSLCFLLLNPLSFSFDMIWREMGDGQEDGDGEGDGEGDEDIEEDGEGGDGYS